MSLLSALPTVVPEEYVVDRIILMLQRIHTELFTISENTFEFDHPKLNISLTTLTRTNTEKTNIYLTCLVVIQIMLMLLMCLCLLKR